MFDAKKLLDLLVQSGSGGNADLQNTLGRVGSVVGQVFNQAKGGVTQAASEVNQATGASDKASDFLKQATGKAPGDFLSQAKDLVAGNKMAAGAALGGLAAVLLGTGAGRKVVGSAARMGGMALIGGLAYKALQNWQAGKPLLDLQNAASALPATPPALPGSDSERALRFVRAMVAAASADGIIDDAERAAILGNLKSAGLDDEAASFIDQEFANPADISTLADGIASPDEAAQVYAAARLAIDPDTAEEQAFLAALAQSLALDAGLVAHIDAAAASAKA